QAIWVSGMHTPAPTVPDAPAVSPTPQPATETENSTAPRSIVRREKRMVASFLDCASYLHTEEPSPRSRPCAKYRSVGTRRTLLSGIPPPALSGSAPRQSPIGSWAIATPLFGKRLAEVSPKALAGYLYLRSVSVRADSTDCQACCRRRVATERLVSARRQ